MKNNEVENLKSIQKINNQLGHEYHLAVKRESNKIAWSLYKKYDNPKVFFSKDNEAIMTSEKNSLEELKEFAKKHKKLTAINFEYPLSFIYTLLTLILAIANLWLNNTFIRGFILGINITTMFWLIIIEIKEVVNLKIKISDLKLHEKKLDEEIKELEKLCMNSQEH